MRWLWTLIKSLWNRGKIRHRELGKYGEDIATQYLARRGYRIIARNVRTYVGEIDIVAKEGDMLVFVETKTRKSLGFGPPYLAITQRKKKKLIQCSLCYIKMKNIKNPHWRIDVISIELDKKKVHIKKIEHFKDALDE